MRLVRPEWSVAAAPPPLRITPLLAPAAFEQLAHDTAELLQKGEHRPARLVAHAADCGERGGGAGVGVAPLKLGALAEAALRGGRGRRGGGGKA